MGTVDKARLRHLVIVPDGILGAIPFEALTVPGSGRLVVERFDVAYLPTAGLLLRRNTADPSSWRAPWQRQLIAFGAPAVTTTAESKGSGMLLEEPLQPLPGSEAEIHAIESSLGGRKSSYLGAADRKKPLLKGAAAGFPVLHIGSHAVSDTESPENSRILFSPATEGGEMDYLFLREVYSLDLSDVDLVTLSACDTERGEIVTGEGGQGFSRALLVAGAAASVTSLWKIEDRPAAEFMKQFYYELGQGESKAEALRRAKLTLLRSGSVLHSPRYWAAFILNGDGAHPIRRSLSWAALLLPIATLILVLALLTRHLGSKTRARAA